eukprot:GHVN01051397.1.p1 GENE.GHVN01051397.1~~GHVN01051397.1.p1  ORF type:complete len:453 (-),score=50.43 GHVN01051397.1:983-2341(-)
MKKTKSAATTSAGHSRYPTTASSTPSSSGWESGWSSSVSPSRSAHPPIRSPPNKRDQRYGDRRGPPVPPSDPSAHLWRAPRSHGRRAEIGWPTAHLVRTGAPAGKPPALPPNQHTGEPLPEYQDRQPRHRERNPTELVVAQTSGCNDRGDPTVSLTVKNYGPHVKLKTIKEELSHMEGWDITLALTPRRLVANPTQRIQGTQVQKLLKKVCKGSMKDDPIAEALLKDIETHKKDISRQRLQEIVYELLLKSLLLVGCRTQIFYGNDVVFLHCRLQEDAARRAAEHRYPVQFDQAVLPKALHEFRNDDAFVMPYASYNPSAERVNGFAAFYKHGRVWSRFDRLSRPVRLPEFDPNDPELSLFRDVDRARLLYRLLCRYWELSELHRNQLIEGIVILHQPPRLRNLAASWYSPKQLLRLTRPIDDIRNYFGGQNEVSIVMLRCIDRTKHGNLAR